MCHSKMCFSILPVDIWRRTGTFKRSRQISLSHIVSKTVETVQRFAAGFFLAQLKLGVNEKRADASIGVILTQRR